MCYSATHSQILSISLSSLVYKATETVIKILYNVACRLVARQRPQHRRDQQYRNSVLYVRGRSVAMQRARCDVTQQYVAVTRPVSCDCGDVTLCFLWNIFCWSIYGHYIMGAFVSGSCICIRSYFDCYCYKHYILFTIYFGTFVHIRKYTNFITFNFFSGLLALLLLANVHRMEVFIFNFMFF
jgi:hypothetical protein